MLPDAIALNDSNTLKISRIQISEPEKLVDVCASKALTVSGENLSVEELLTEIHKDLPFYREDGGVTLSGGEPLAQGADLVLLLQDLHKQRISTNIETSLHVKWKMIERTIGLVKTYLVDLKHTDSVKFRHYAGGDAKLVMENLEKLAYFGAHVVVRIPVIPGFNHSEKEVQALVDFVSTIKGIEEIHFLPYHSFGAEKYRMLGMDYLFDSTAQLGEEDMLPYVQYAQLQGFKTKTGG